MTYNQHFKENLRLGIPVVISQLGTVLVNFFDTLMIGNIFDPNKSKNYSDLALGGVSLANSLFFMIFVFALGISFSISPLIAQAKAQNKREEIKNIFSNGFILNIFAGIILFLFSLPIFSILDILIYNKIIMNITRDYLFINLLSLIPLMIFQSYRQLSEGLYYTKGVTYSTLFSNTINIIFNYLLINGNFGFPQLGVIGAAIATLISRVLMIFFLIFFLKNHNEIKKILKFRIQKPTWLYQKKLFILGFPIGFQMFFEVSAFSMAAFICEKNSSIDLAAHHITLQLASMTFLLCSGISVAATIQVGKFKGLLDIKNQRKSGLSSIYLVVFFMILSGISMIIFRKWIPTLFSINELVINLSSILFIIAAIFQVADGVQVVALGALRGTQDVLIPSLITFFCYWLLAIPLGWILTINFKMGAIGMWISLGLSLIISSFLLTYRFISITKK